MKKPIEHTGFKNGDLFCFHCGESQTLPLPMEAKLAADFMLLFSKHHKSCPKTWTEPVAEANGKSNQTTR